MYVAFVFCRHNSSKHSSFKIDVLANMFIIAVRYKFTLFRSIPALFNKEKSQDEKVTTNLGFSITMISGAADRQSGDFKCAHQAPNLVLKGYAV